MNKPHAVVPDVALGAADEDDSAALASRPTVVQSVPEIPEYLRKVYTWAYLNPYNARHLDNWFVVSAILWGNANRLARLGFSEFEPGQSVLQPACVYGSFSQKLAERLHPGGHLHVTDVAANQVEACRAKLVNYPDSTVGFANAGDPRDRDYDGVCCFFLLHEVPEDYKHRIVNNLLDATRPGGKTVFVDYHRPHWAHPLNPIMWPVWWVLEPYAVALCRNEIRSYATADREKAFTWSKETYFGGLYQKVVAVRQA